MSQMGLEADEGVSAVSAFGAPVDLSLSEKISRSYRRTRALLAAVKLIADPNKLDQVFEIADDR